MFYLNSTPSKLKVNHEIKNTKNFFVRFGVYQLVYILEGENASF